MIISIFLIAVKANHNPVFSIFPAKIIAIKRKFLKIGVVSKMQAKFLIALLSSVVVPIKGYIHLHITNVVCDACKYTTIGVRFSLVFYNGINAAMKTFTAADGAFHCHY